MKSSEVTTENNKKTGNKPYFKKPKRRALVLSGGGSRGAYQIGVWKALTELGWTFDMVIGVSVGALNGSMVVQDEQLLAENLWRDLETDHVFDVTSDAQTTDFALEFLKQGGAGTHGLKKFVDTYIDDQKIRDARMDLGVLVVEFPSLKPYYLWKEDIPKGRIGDFVMASSSAFPALQVYEIDGKKFVDGGFENNLPIHMAVDRGATDIVAVYLDAIGKFNKEKELASAENVNLTFIQTKWDLGNFLLFDRKNTARIIRLGYLETMKAFGVFDGNFYSFVKGEIEKRQLRGADVAAKIFELDPLILYSQAHFLETLATKVSETSGEFEYLLKLGKQTLSTKGVDFKGIIDMLRHLTTIGTETNGIDLKRAGELFTNYNKKALVLIIAKDLKDNQEGSIFLNRYALRILGDEIAAARFIEKNELI